MNMHNGPQPKRELLPPNIVAFIAGVMLALAVGLAFRKLIDRMNRPGSEVTTLRAQVPAEKQQATTVAGKIFAETEIQPEKILPQTNTPSSEQNPAKAASPMGAAATTTVTAGEEADITENSAGEVEYISWRQLLRNFEQRITAQGTTKLNVTLTPRYRHQAKGLAITRGQFLDVVSRKVPANLPTRSANVGMILHALSAQDFDSTQFVRAARDSTAQLLPLCRTEKSPLSLAGVERITLLVSNTPQFFKCVLDLFETTPQLTEVAEITLVGFTRGSTFYGSLSAQKKLLSLQMWNPDWLLDNTVGLEETGSEKTPHRRALRLANVTRALGQPSDVRMQIPASHRSLVGPLVDPQNPTPPKPLVVGNFALVPSHMPRGSLIATAFTSPGQDRSKIVTVKPPGVGKTKALVLATQGKTMQFMSVTREQ